MRFSFAFASILSLSACCFAQFQLPALERVKEIKLLESDRDAVRQLLQNYKLDSSSDHSDDFSSADASIEVSYSTGNCDENEDEIWNIPEGRVTRIEVLPEAEIRIDELGINLSSLKKEQLYANDLDSLIYHDKDKGIAIRVDDGEVDRFILFPPVNRKSVACKNETAENFISMKSWFGKSKLKEREIIEYFTGNVINVNLNKEELTQLNTKKEILVSVTASNLANDVPTYGYTVSFGTIIGKGDNVVWDLSGAGMGIYTITVAVDDGCGLCGRTITKTIVVK